jgi:DNA-binding NtrC family response regulator
MMGPENPNWNGGPRTVTCAHCGAETKRNAFQTQWKRTFCNSQCYGAWMHAHPEESNRRKNIDWSDLPALYASGLSVEELLQRYGVGRTTLYRKLQQAGITPQRHSPRKPR